MSFERFTQSGRSYKPKVSISSRGLISFNKAAVQNFNIRKKTFAILFYERDTRRIGIKFTDDDNEKGIRKIYFRQAGAYISVRSFLNYYGIDYSRTKKYDLVLDHEAGLYMLKL